MTHRACKRSSLNAFSADLQQVDLSLRVLSRPKEQMLPRIQKELGADFQERVMPSIGNEVLKAVVVLSSRSVRSKLTDSSGAIQCRPAADAS